VPGYDPAAARDIPEEASFDSCWQGGFEEMFPNDAACTVDDCPLPDHGEAWSARWNVPQASALDMTLSMRARSMPLRLEKHVRLEADAPLVHLRYRITNAGESSLPCMLKLHPALAIEEGDLIELPACSVEPVAPGFGRVTAARSGPTRWPWGEDAAGGRVRLDRALPASSGAREFVYCSHLEEGRCGVRNTRTGSRLQLTFDRSDFPFVWVFQSYGGFNGHYVLMLEPCTSKPYDLRDAIAENTALWIPRQSDRTLQLTLQID
jgi:hypothetical protein